MIKIVLPYLLIIFHSLMKYSPKGFCGSLPLSQILNLALNPGSLYKSGTVHALLSRYCDSRTFTHPVQKSGSRQATVGRPAAYIVDSLKLILVLLHVVCVNARLSQVNPLPSQTKLYSELKQERRHINKSESQSKVIEGRVGNDGNCFWK